MSRYDLTIYNFTKSIALPIIRSMFKSMTNGSLYTRWILIQGVQIVTCRCILDVSTSGKNTQLMDASFKNVFDDTGLFVKTEYYQFAFFKCHTIFISFFLDTAVLH